MVLPPGLPLTTGLLMHRFLRQQPPPRPAPLANPATGQIVHANQAQQAETEANFFDALRAVTPTLIITGIAIGIASGLGTTIGSTLGTLIVSRFDRKPKRRR